MKKLRVENNNNNNNKNPTILKLLWQQGLFKHGAELDAALHLVTLLNNFQIRSILNTDLREITKHEFTAGIMQYWYHHITSMDGSFYCMVSGFLRVWAWVGLEDAAALRNTIQWLLPLPQAIIWKILTCFQSWSVQFPWFETGWEKGKIIWKLKTFIYDIWSLWRDCSGTPRTASVCLILISAKAIHQLIYFSPVTAGLSSHLANNMLGFTLKVVVWRGHYTA